MLIDLGKASELTGAKNGPRSDAFPNGGFPQHP
jgi:hypothetical protein